jgi:hypothetical protein
VLLPLALVQSGLTRDGAVSAAFSGWLSGLADIKDFYLVALIPAAFVTVAALLLQAKRDASFIIGCAGAGAAVALVLTLLFGRTLDLPLDGRFGYAFVGGLAAAVCAFITRR